MFCSNSVCLRFQSRVAFVLSFVAAAIAERLQIALAVIATVDDGDNVIASKGFAEQGSATPGTSPLEFIVDAQSYSRGDGSVRC